MELRDYLRILRRRWVSILLVTLLVTGIAAGITALQTPVYQSTARLFVTTTSESDDSALLQGGQFSAQRVKSYADLVTSRELANRVIADLGLETDPETLSQDVSADVVLDTVNLSLTATNTDPGDAQAVAQAYAEELTDLVRELETPPGGTSAPIKATIVDAASLPEAPTSPKVLRNLGLAVVLGFFIAFGVALLREILDTRIRNTGDLAQVTPSPVLGTIVLDPAATKTPLVTQIPSHAPRAESFRVLRTNLQFVDVDSSNKVFVVSSAVPAEGKTSTAVNLALSLAQGGTKTLLIECDLRRPRAATRLNMDDAVGVTSVLVGSVPLTDAIQPVGSSGLELLPAGPIPPNPAELLQSNAMADLLSHVRELYDVVVVDAPPLLPVTDAALLAAKADGAMLVVSHGKVTRDQVAGAIERLDQVGARLIGVVMNRVPNRTGSYGYGYGYGYEPEPATNSDH